MKLITNSLLEYFLKSLERDRFGYSIVIAFVVGGLTNSILGFVVGYAFIQFIAQLMSHQELPSMEKK